MNLETLYLKTEQKTPFQIINTDTEIIIFENRHAPFSLYSKYYVAQIKDLILEEKKTIIIDYIQGSNKDTMQVLILKDIQPCLGNFKKIKDLSLEQVKLIHSYYAQEFLQNSILTSYYEFIVKTFFKKKEALEVILKNKSI